MLLESEAGVARNEPVTFAVRKAIEAGVAEIIHSGAKKDLWKIKLPPEPVLPENVEESDAEVVTDEQVKVEGFEGNGQRKVPSSTGSAHQRHKHDVQLPYSSPVSQLGTTNNCAFPHPTSRYLNALLHKLTKGDHLHFQFATQLVQSKVDSHY